MLHNIAYGRLKGLSKTKKPISKRTDDDTITVDNIKMPPCGTESVNELMKMDTDESSTISNTLKRIQQLNATATTKQTLDTYSSSTNSPNYNFTHVLHFNELKKTQNILEKSEQSAFTHVVSSNKHNAKQNPPTGTGGKPFSFSSSHTLTRPITTTESTEPISLKQLTQISGARHVHKSSNISQLIGNPSNHSFSSISRTENNTIQKTSNAPKSKPFGIEKKHKKGLPCVSTELDVSLNTCNTFSDKEFCADVSPLKYLPAIQEENCNPSLLSMDDKNKNLEPTSNVTSFADSQMSDASNSMHSSQTLFLALPEFNVNQFSNQTLNLDYTSQQVLKALLQPNLNIANENMQADKDTTESLSSKAQTFISMLDDSDEVNETTENMKEPLKQTDCLPSIENFENATKLNINEPQTTTAFLNTNTELSSSLQDTVNGKQDSNNPLPVAAINVNMIDGQPVYTIQLMGQSIPLAAITIPTSDGPLQLQSATTSLTSHQQTKNQDNIFPFVEDDKISISNSALSSSQGASKQRYTCEICNKSYIRSWSYYGHLREHAGGPKEHKCYMCHKVFTTIAGLKQHLQVHSGQKDFFCSVCNKSFSSASSLRNHQMTHVTEKLYPCKIEGCDKSFGNATALRIHQRVHQDDKPFKCAHADCEKAFKTTSELSRHEFRHTGEKPFKCDKCEKSFVRNDDLKRHYFIHTGQKRFKCDQCEFSCIQSFDLVKHKYIHGGEKPYKCDICNKQFTRPARLREHQRLHTGERPYVCEECGKSFKQLTSLKTHKLTHGAAKPFNCETCTKTFSSAAELRSHVNTHLGVKPFRCPLCNKDFVSSKTLKRHAIVHTGEKPHECSICKRKFARASDLKVHTLVHDEDKPFKCDQCSKMFTRYSTLKEHLRFHTGQFPFKCNVCEKEFNHRSHYNMHLRTHTGEKPHKCHKCPKEFSRKAGLRQHLRVHGIGDASLQSVEDDNDNNFSETNFGDTGLVNAQQVIQLDANNLQLLKTIQNVLKRKHNECDEEDNMVARKRHMTELPIITNITSGDASHGQIGDVAVVNTSELESVLNTDNPVILTQLSTGQFTQLQHNQIVEPDGTTVVALNLSDLQNNEGGPSLIQVHGLDELQSLEGQSFEQHTLSQPLQSNTMAALDNLSILCHDNNVGISSLHEFWCKPGSNDDDNEGDQS